MKTQIKKLLYYLFQRKIDINSFKKIKRFSKNVSVSVINKAQEVKYVNLWERLGKKPPIQFYRILSNINGIFSSRYVPENIQYGLIEPVLNNRAYALTYNDKNFFERYLSNFKSLFPTAILRGINGVIHDVNYNIITIEETMSLLSILNNNDEFILKPATETGGGENVQLIRKVDDGFIRNNKQLSVKEFILYLKENYRNNFIIQHKLKPLPWFHDFNSSSLNTVRLYSYRSVKNEEVHPFHAYIRFGGEGSLVDSSSQGGRTCGVNRNGILNSFALGRYGEKFSNLNCLKEKAGKPVPHFHEMKEIAKQIARSYHYHRLLGFDFTVDENDNIRLLEINTLFIGVINQQMNSGPLYSEFTDEVIEYCKENKKSFVLYFKS